MDAMAIDTGRNVLIAFLGQGSAMHTFLIGIVNGTVTLGAGLRNTSRAPNNSSPVSLSVSLVWV